MANAIPVHHTKLTKKDPASGDEPQEASEAPVAPEVVQPPVVGFEVAPGIMRVDH